MAQINILDEHITQLIAAGEVVERPASAIKELVENSIDSGANKVTIEIKNGGTTFIRVTDDGCGIDKDNIAKAFLPHATSKIKSQSDLENIFTLGFRGEALASIAAVSRTTMISKLKDSVLGTIYKIEGSKQVYIDETGCADGTSIIVEDLFFNTPARMKFLKKDVYEANAVAYVIDRLALSHPEISFSFIRDGKECLTTTGDSDLKTAIYCVYGKEFVDDLVEISYELNDIKINGFISQPIKSRANRSMQHFFINNRYVKNRTATVAVEQAYKGYISNGKFPCYVMYLDINANVVDVNVHPAKTEVRFMNEKPIFNVIYHAVKSALQKNDGQINIDIKDSVLTTREPVQLQESPKIMNTIVETSILSKDLTLEESGQVKLNLDSHINHNENSVKKVESPEIFIPQAHDYEINKQSNINSEDKLIYSECQNVYNHPIRKKSSIEYDIRQDFKDESNFEQVFCEKNNQDFKGTLIDNKDIKKSVLIGEIFKTYIITQRENELVLIDKHAAHEGLIYNRLKKDGLNGYSQCLFEPLKVTLSKKEYGAVLENIDKLSDLGFDIDDFGQGVIIIRSAPMILNGKEIKDAFIEIAGYIYQNISNLSTKHIDWIYKSIACKAAIKAGDNNNEGELISLLAELDANNDVKYCPHGRPIYIIMTKKELEKQFKRT